MKKQNKWRMECVYVVRGTDLPAVGTQQVVMEGTRGQRQLLRLLDQRSDDARVAVPLVDGRVRGEAVEVARARDVPHVHARAAR